MKIKNFALINKIAWPLAVTGYIVALCIILTLATLDYSRNINKQVMRLKEEIRTKQVRLQSFGSEIIKAIYTLELENLTCKERITLKFDIIKVMYSINPWIKEPLQKEALYFEDKVFKDKNRCAKDFYDKDALDKIQEKIISQLSSDLKKKTKELHSLQLSIFYTNET